MATKSGHKTDINTLYTTLAITNLAFLRPEILFPDYGIFRYPCDFSESTRASSMSQTVEPPEGAGLWLLLLRNQTPILRNGVSLLLLFRARENTRGCHAFHRPCRGSQIQLGKNQFFPTV